MQYKYELDKSSKKYICPRCHHKRFVLYVDSATNQPIAKHVGRCDRENSCGYHYTPKDYFENNTYIAPLVESPQPTPEPPKLPSYIDNDVLLQTLKCYDKNIFVQWLVSVVGREYAMRAVDAYKIGTAKDGYTIFWQIDTNNNVRTGKKMLYQTDGHRDKNGDHAKIDWVHTKYKNFTLQQCLFGEHLINDNPNKQIALVESEKTAILCSVIMPKYIWLATGGCGGISPNKCKALYNKNVVLFPDAQKYNEWEEKAQKHLHNICNMVTISNYIETHATDKELQDGIDIADLLIKHDLKQYLSDDMVDLRCYKPQNQYQLYDGMEYETSISHINRLFNGVNNLKIGEIYKITDNFEPSNYKIAVHAAYDYIQTHPNYTISENYNTIMRTE